MNQQQISKAPVVVKTSSSALPAATTAATIMDCTVRRRTIVRSLVAPGSIQIDLLSAKDMFI
jgi:hypothetical protein